jgi:hypothetical protein
VRIVGVGMTGLRGRMRKLMLVLCHAEIFR